MDMRHYSSFLLRCWDLDEMTERVEIEHIQSHESTVLHTIADAVEWIRIVHHGADVRAQDTDDTHPDEGPTKGRAR